MTRSTLDHPRAVDASPHVAALVLLLASCSGGYSGTRTVSASNASDPPETSPIPLTSGSLDTGAPGMIHDNPAAGPDESQQFIVDPNNGGQAAEVRLVRAAWGRLVDVFALDNSGGERLQQREFVIDADIQTDSQDYVLETELATGTQRLVILRNIKDESPGGGKEQFFDLLKQSEQNLAPIFDNGLPQGNGPWTMVPRNAAVVLQFDDLLDEASANADTVRVATGAPPIVPYEGRILLDRNHGDYAILGNDTRRTFYGTRVIVDTTVSELEAFSQNPPLPINLVGLPASFDVNVSNTVVRVPTVVNPPTGQNEILTNVAGNGLATTGNGTIDFSSPTLDLVRSMRSGGPSNLTGDPYNGFLRDEDGPGIVGILDVDVTIPPIQDVKGDELDFVLASVDFLAVSCAQTPDVGDMLLWPGFIARVTRMSPPESGGTVARINVRLRFGDPQAFLAQGPGPAQFVTAYDPLIHAGQEACFAQIFPTPTGYPSNPTTGVLPSSTLGLAFTEPLDPRSWEEALQVHRAQPPTSGFDFVVGTVTSSLDLTEATFVPDLPLAHGLGAAEPYWLVLQTSPSAVTDLAGNPLTVAFPPVEFTLEPSAAAARNGGHVSRFSSPDEDPPFGNASTGPLPEWSGQHVFDLARELIRPRPVVRFEGVADRTQPVPSLMTPFFPGAQTPLSNLGSKLQTMWRHVDVGFSLTDFSTLNLDVEGMSWAPAGGQVILDQYAEFEIRLSHSKWAPDEYLDAATLFPKWANSGLAQTYTDNLLDPVEDPQKIVHDRALGYTVNPGDLFAASTGTPMMPFPMNQGLPANQFEYYTWRDTGIRARAGANVGGVDPDQLYAALGQTPPTNRFMSGSHVATQGLPLLMEFRTWPDSQAFGLNAFDVSIAANSSSRPYFRAFSTGGINTSQNVVLVDPDLETQANGGFNPNSTPTPGQQTYGRDNFFYIGALDLVVRVSRSHSVWRPTPNGAGPATILTPVFQPAVVIPSEQPLGTAIEIAYRGATSIVGNPQALGDAQTIDLYGDHYDDSMVIPPAQPNHNPQFANGGIAFLGADSVWRDDASAIDGARYFQQRITFVANPVTGLVPELRALSQTWRE